MKQQKKIDIHTHTTNRPLPRTFYGNAKLQTIYQNAAKHNVEETIVLASYFPHKESGISNFRMLNWTLPYNKINMFASLDFNHFFKQGYSELEELVTHPKVKGVKVYTGYQDIDLDGDKLHQVLSLAEKNQIPVMFHTGLSYTAKRNYGRETISDKVVAKDLEFIGDYYDVDVILSHMAKPYHDDLIRVLNKNKRFHTDVSGLIDSKYDQDQASATIESVSKVASEAGPHKILFGTDFPVQSYEDSIMFVEQGLKGFSEQDKQKVYYNNAKQILTKKKND